MAGRTDAEARLREVLAIPVPDALDAVDSTDPGDRAPEIAWAGPPPAGWLPPGSLPSQVRALVSARVPGALRGAALSLGRRGVWTVGVLLLAGVGLTAALVVHGRARAVTIPPPGPVPVLPSVSPLPTALATAPPAVMVDVEGKVVRPGVVRLVRGARVADALAAAGGALPGADLSTINRARPLVDGEQIRVAVPGLPEAATGGAGSSVPAGGGGPVNLNTATAAQLDALPGVGPVTAQHILDWRAQHGGFTSVEQLQEVSGIGLSTYAKLSTLVSV